MLGVGDMLRGGDTSLLGEGCLVARDTKLPARSIFFFMVDLCFAPDWLDCCWATLALGLRVLLLLFRGFDFSSSPWLESSLLLSSCLKRCFGRRRWTRPFTWAFLTGQPRFQAWCLPPQFGQHVLVFSCCLCFFKHSLVSWSPAQTPHLVRFVQRL